MKSGGCVVFLFSVSRLPREVSFFPSWYLYVLPYLKALSCSEQEMRSFPRSWQMKTELENWSAGWRMSSESRREKGPNTDTGALWPGSGPQRCPGDSEQGENQGEVRLRILGSSWMAFCRAEPESTGDSITDAEPELSLDPYSDPKSIFLTCSKRQQPGNFFSSSSWLFFIPLKNELPWQFISWPTPVFNHAFPTPAQWSEINCCPTRHRPITLPSYCTAHHCLKL